MALDNNIWGVRQSICKKLEYSCHAAQNGAVATAKMELHDLKSDLDKRLFRVESFIEDCRLNSIDVPPEITAQRSYYSMINKTLKPFMDEVKSYGHVSKLLDLLEDVKDSRQSLGEVSISSQSEEYAGFVEKIGFLISYLTVADSYMDRNVDAKELKSELTTAYFIYRGRSENNQTKTAKKTEVSFVGKLVDIINRSDKKTEQIELRSKLQKSGPRATQRIGSQRDHVESSKEDLGLRLLEGLKDIDRGSKASISQYSKRFWNSDFLVDKLSKE